MQLVQLVQMVISKIENCKPFTIDKLLFVFQINNRESMLYFIRDSRFNPRFKFFPDKQVIGKLIHASGQAVSLNISSNSVSRIGRSMRSFLLKRLLNRSWSLFKVSYRGSPCKTTTLCFQDLIGVNYSGKIQLPHRQYYY